MGYLDGTLPGRHVPFLTLHPLTFSLGLRQGYCVAAKAQVDGKLMRTIRQIIESITRA